MTARQDRLEQNQQRFRKANEGLEGVVAHKVRSEQVVPFLCECPDENCLDTVPLTLSVYEEIRSHRNHFFVVSGHPTSPGERVVSRQDSYEVVEKSSDD